MRNLSKSKLIAFRQCPKRLWLEIHRPELRDDSASQAVMNTGNRVGELARGIYDPEANGTLINVEALGYDEAFARSRELLEDSVAPIFEAGLRIDGALAFADVMLPEATEGGIAWRMIEVKSSTSVKDYHRDDVAVQSFIATAAGIRLSAVSVAHIDNTFVYAGDGDYRGLLVERDLTAEAASRHAEVEQWLADAQEVAAHAEEPAAETGDHCHSPFPCGFSTWCNRGRVLPEFPIRSLPNLSGRRRAAVEAEGTADLRGIPDHLLTPMQLRVKQAAVSGEAYFDAAGAAAALAGHGWPAGFLDYETTNMAVPIWKGTRPYQQIPFQFSLHVMQEDRALDHREFLDLSGNDPRRGFAETLVETCGESGPIFVYNIAFERRITRELAAEFPDLSPALTSIVDRMVDLLPVVRSHYYHPSQHGSWSIKAVLPAAVPDLSYDQLDGVKDGGMAMEAFAEAISPATPPDRKEELRRQLLAYCQLDTLAMVRLWAFFTARRL